MFRKTANAHVSLDSPRDADGASRLTESQPTSNMVNDGNADRRVSPRGVALDVRAVTHGAIRYTDEDRGKSLRDREAAELEDDVYDNGPLQVQEEFLALGRAWPTEITEIGESQNLDGDEAQLLLYELKMENTGVYDFLGVEFQVMPSEEIVMNPLMNRMAMSKQGLVGTFITIVKAFIGIGILTLPFAMTHGGYIGGPIGLVILSYLAHYCMQLVLISSKAVRDAGPEKERGDPLSFGGLGMKVAGIWGRRAVDWSLIVSQCGFCIAYIIFICENVSAVICHDTKMKVCPSKNAVAFVTVMMLTPFCLLKSMKTLAIPTLLANVALIGGVIWGYRSAFYVGIGSGPGLVAVNFSGYPIFFGMGVFTFEGIGMILPIQHVMEEPEKMSWLLRFAMVLLTCLFVSFGLLCYVTYGSETNSMITANYPVSKLTSFVRLFYALGVFFTFPIMMFPVFQLFERIFKTVRQGPRRDLKRCAMRFTIVSLSGIVAVSVPDFGLFLGLIGSVTCTLLSYILPAIFHYYRPGKSKDDINSVRSDRIDKGLFIFGVVGGLISFCVTLSEFLQ
eukprot:GEMP01028521.1.p1 GENE.GEMP01028521.1~~GEMP01028521.1.p1  ORF type:complete len:563 (+),score=80.20 GEMP01028521.1:87-1775(+)